MGYQDGPNGDDFNDDYVDSIDDELDPEGPSVADLRRLRHSGAKCPSCGADVYDEAEVCPVCGDYIIPESGGSGNRKALNIVVAVVLVVLILMWAL